MARFGDKGVDVKDLPARMAQPIEFRPVRGGRSAFGYEATTLADICEVVLAARRAKVLTTKHERRLAEHCELLISGFVRVGLIALIDEATGFQYDRARKSLEEILEQFIAKELVAWERTFPSDFYENLFRLKGWTLKPGTTKRPMILAALTVDLVYERLAPGVLDELRRKSPKDEKGRRKNKLHQWLSEEVGYPKLKEHFAALRSLWRVNKDFVKFYAMVEQALPKFGETRPLPFPFDDEPDGE